MSKYDRFNFEAIKYFNTIPDNTIIEKIIQTLKKEKDE